MTLNRIVHLFKGSKRFLVVIIFGQNTIKLQEMKL